MSPPLSRRRLLGVGTAGVAAVLLGWRQREYRFPGETVQRGESDEIQHTESAESRGVTYTDDGHVEVVVARSGGEPVETEVLPFEEWATGKAQQIAVSATSTHLSEHVLSEEERSAVGLNTASGTLNVRYGESVAEQSRDGVLIEYIHRVSQGDLYAKPPFDYSHAVDFSPRAVTVTVSLSGHTHTSRTPVWVQRIKGGPILPG